MKKDASNYDIYGKQELVYETEQAEKRGFEQGLEEGIKEGIQTNIKETAIKMISKGYSEQEIKYILNIDEDTLLNIKKEL